MNSGWEHFIGVWKLIRVERTFADGRVDYPFGSRPAGSLIYDKAGRMAVQVMRPGRSSTVASGVSLSGGNARCEEIREAVDGCIAYFGTYDVDETTQTVIHRVEACLVPGWEGTDLNRPYRFEGNRLILTAVGITVLELVWEREPE